VLANCAGANEVFADAAACWAAAVSVPDAPATPWPTGGDSIQCRIYHAEVAALSGDPATHCPHAGGAAPCGSGGGGSGCPAGEIEDCYGHCAPLSWLGDGGCDSVFNCAAHYFDDGDCTSAR
jgi:hypothetical protein